MDRLIRALQFLPFDFTPRRLQILGLLLTIIVLLLVSWYRGPVRPPAPRPAPAPEPGLAARFRAVLPRDVGSADEAGRFAAVFRAQAQLVARSRAQNLVAKSPQERGEYQTVEQVLRATRLANAEVLKEERKAVWRPFFDALGAEIQARYDRDELRELEQLEALYTSLAGILQER